MSTKGSRGRPETSAPKWDWSWIMNWQLAAVAAGILAVTPAGAYARDLGNLQKGETIARKSCVACHAINGGIATSPNSKAPPFASLAQTPGMTAIALRAALQTSHRTMPNLVLRKGQREDVIAYILSLKSAPLELSRLRLGNW